MKGQTFGLRELIGGPEASMQRMQKGVYMFSGLGKRFGTITEKSSEGNTRFMAMTVERARFLDGFLVLGSRSDESFSTTDLQRLLRLKEHASSAVAKAGAIKDLEDKNSELDVSNRQLVETQQQLVSHEKLAALGELTAGIAHEIQNPLNFVNNFSDLSCELLDEFQQGLQAREHTLDPHMHKLLELIKSNCDHIRQHGRRATSIVEAMILHSHSGTSSRSRVQLNDLIDEFALLAYHGMRLQYPQFSLDLQREFDADVGKVEVLPQEMSRAIVNICNNAWEAAIAKAAGNGHGEDPAVAIRSKRSEQSVHIIIRDNGDGVPDAIREKMFEPFFTTKRSSRNAGLGLSLTYEIITKLHHGKLAVRSEPGQFTECEIILPVNQ
jgi:signal transduction histidine kinase